MEYEFLGNGHRIQKRSEFVISVSPLTAFSLMNHLICAVFLSVYTNSATCTETEAWNIPDSFWYTSPEVDLKTVGNGMIIDQDSSTSKSIYWKYDGSRTGDKICACKQWEAAYSLTEPTVWNATGSSLTLSCPQRPGATSMGYENIIGNSFFPREKWFWFSARQIGATANTFVSNALPGLKLCLRPRVYMDYTLNPEYIVFFRGVALVNVSWEENRYDTSRCGEKQAVKLISYDYYGYTQTYEATNGIPTEIRLSYNPFYYKFSLGMGISSVNSNTWVYVYWCNQQESNAFTVRDVDDTHTTWRVEWSYYWYGAGCYNLELNKNTQFVVSYTAKSIETDTVIEETNTTIYSTESLSFTASLSNPENYGSLGVRASITISLYYTPTGGFINSVSRTHIFCSPVLATLEPNNLTLVDDAQCEPDDEDIDLAINLPSVTSWGRSCGQQLWNKRYITEDGREYNANRNQYETTKVCDDRTYTYVFYAMNGYSAAQSDPLAVHVCRNTNPAAPTELRSNDNGYGASVVSGPNNVVSVSWAETAHHQPQLLLGTASRWEVALASASSPLSTPTLTTVPSQ